MTVGCAYACAPWHWPSLLRAVLASRAAEHRALPRDGRSSPATGDRCCARNVEGTRVAEWKCVLLTGRLIRFTNVSVPELRKRHGAIKGNVVYNLRTEGRARIGAGGRWRRGRRDRGWGWGGGEELSNAELICQKSTKASNARDGGVVVAVVSVTIILARNVSRFDSTHVCEALARNEKIERARAARRSFKRQRWYAVRCVYARALILSPSFGASFAANPDGADSRGTMTPRHVAEETRGWHSTHRRQRCVRLLSSRLSPILLPVALFFIHFSRVSARARYPFSPLPLWQINSAERGRQILASAVCANVSRIDSRRRGDRQVRLPFAAG